MNNNLDENTMNKIKNMVDNGDISSAISQISPEMIENFSKMLSNSQNKQNTNTQNQNTYSKDKQTNSNSSVNGFNNNMNSSSQSSSNANFDFNNIDINTILKMKSIMEKINNSNDSRSNLLQSLKPYLRETKQEKLDQYANLLKVANVAELMKNNKKGDFK